ncbi:MAG TPA: D-glycero-beta-D-manno-heptose-7-phosphate kinase [Verrucomicrobiae bacterium]|nr:D-glycero-beta-D-manno-heptose-7-phosphate kinase [Verrucomicrobiae bacterium]
MDSSRLGQIAAKFAAQRILVIGDLMLDEFLWGQVSRISPEAPVPVVDVVSETYYPGGAANAARNVREFAAATSLLGIIGVDSASDRLLDLIARGGIDSSLVQRDPGRTTTVKTRVIARNQQVVRVDRERRTALTPAQTDLAIEQIERALPSLDGVIVADYGKGFLDQRLADAICAMTRGHRKVLTVDPHPHTSLAWHGATAIKPNRAEAYSAAGIRPPDSVDPARRIQSVIEAAERLLEIWQTENLLITLGEQGMLLFETGQPPYHTPTRAKDVFDVSGAGDTAIAVLTLALCAGATAQEAAELANVASGIVVGKLGTATVTMAELLSALASS